MRITVSHNKTPAEIKANIDRSFDDIFKGLPMGPVQISEEHRTWVGDTMNFSFHAKAAFIAVPVKGWIAVEPAQVTIEVELPSFLKNFLPEEKVKTAVESRIRGLLT